MSRDPSDEGFMRLALEQAAEAERHGEVPIGAVVVVDGRTVGRGFNSCIRLADPTAHAEILAIRDAAETTENYRLTGACLFCTVEPCLMCLGAGIHARLGRVVFGAADPKVGATGALETLRQEGAGLNHGFDVAGGILAGESAALLTRFFRERRGLQGGETSG